MPTPITIPRLGWSMEEGTLVEWLKAPGELIRRGDMLFVLEGEKAAQEIESLDSGVLCLPADAPRPGETVNVGQVIGFLLADGESPPASVQTSPDVSARAALPEAPPAAASSPRAAGPAARRLARQLGIDLSAVATPDPTGRVVTSDVRRAMGSRLAPPQSEPGAPRRVATPRARRRARELGIDWGLARGTGRDERVRERDVVALAAHSPSNSHAEFVPLVQGHHQPASRIRQSIAQRMLAGVQQTAPVTLTTKLDATALVAWREQEKLATAGNIVPTYTDAIMKLVAEALPEEPRLNACWVRDGVYLFDAINIAVAVDTEYGLVAPVISNVRSLSLQKLAQQSRNLVELARTGALSQSQLEGGTFTLTNLGMFGIDFFTPIINLPQAAILGIGRIVREPVVQGGGVVVGQTLGLSLTFDHRVIDGAPAARWLQRLAQLIEQPGDALHGRVGEVGERV